MFSTSSNPRNMFSFWVEKPHTPESEKKPIASEENPLSPSSHNLPGKADPEVPKVDTPISPIPLQSPKRKLGSKVKGPAIDLTGETDWSVEKNACAAYLNHLWTTLGEAHSVMLERESFWRKWISVRLSLRFDFIFGRTNETSTRRKWSSFNENG